MTSDALQLMRAWINGIWGLFNSWYIPGTRFTPAQWFFFLLMVPLVVKLLKATLTLGLAEFYSSDRGGSDNYNPNQLPGNYLVKK